jgi:hypothetical protein
MQKCIEVMFRKKVRLRRQKAGKWTHRHSPVNNDGVPLEQYGSRTILAMLDQGLAESTERRGYDDEIIEIGLTELGEKTGDNLVNGDPQEETEASAG